MADDKRIPKFPKLTPGQLAAMEAYAKVVQGSLPKIEAAMEVLRGQFASWTKQDWRDFEEGFALWERLPPEQQELYADWTPRQLLAMKGLLEEAGVLHDPGDRRTDS